MTKSYNFKLIKSGKYVETYHYKTKWIYRDFERKQPVRSTNAKTGVKKPGKQKAKAKSSIARTRTNIRRLTNSNPHLLKFLTLTFAEEMTDLKQANYLFNTAMKRVLRAKPYFQYIAVVEYQGDTYFKTGLPKPNGGSVHYHLLCNISTDKTALHLQDRFAWERWFAMRFWKNGFVKVKDVTTIDNMGLYFCKYLGKDMFDKRMFNKKKFFCSQSLKKPEELRGWEAKSLFNHHEPHMKKTFEKTFENEHAGEVEYRAYILEKQ